VALGVLKRAAGQLEFSAAEYGGFSVPDLSASVRRIMERKQFSNFRL